MNGILENLVAHKDWLLLTCFSVDAVNTMISFPLIMWNGPKWLLKSTDPDAVDTDPKDVVDLPDTDRKSLLKPTDTDAKETVEINPKEVVDLSDTDRKSFEVLWEIFGIAYEGYFGFTISTLVCLFQVPETRPIFGYSLFALYLYKARSFFTTFKTDNAQGKAKLASILYFYWPCYGGYCLLHAIQKYYLS